MRHAFGTSLKGIRFVPETLAELRHHLEHRCFVVNNYDLGHILERKLD